MKEKKKELNIFTYLNSFFYKNYQSDLSKFVPFLVNRWISNDYELLPYAFFINKYNSPFISKQMVYDFYFFALPKGKKFIKYNSKKEKIINNMKLIQKWLQCNYDEAKVYAKIVKPEVLKELKKVEHL